ncbi:MAG: efflux RND transporter periplasmic adaptor subunit [Opitutaceae bacterium]|nr:efflux RND transporter periplasmic adaptor subunit [Opitutaceae bacterium]
MKAFSLLLCLALTVTGLTAAPATVYQCPMHPWIKSDHAGDKCTICGMTLVATSTADQAPADPNLITLAPASASVVGVQTAAVHRGALSRTLRVTGIVDDDDTSHRILAARVPGRVESLGVKFIGAEIEAGAPLATLFSPEMLTAQRQYVERLRGGDAFTVSERAAARERLLELGLTAMEIDILEHTLEPVAMVNIRAPMSGTVVSRSVYEGQYVKATDPLFEIADFSTMWFVFDAYEPDLAWLRPGQSVAVTVASQPGRTYIEPIAFIDPNLNETTRTARVRVVLPNRDRALLHKQTATARVQLTIPDLLLVPRTAVLQHGADPMVFLEQGDRAYLARRVHLGRIGDTEAEVIDGLEAGDRVVTEGGLILDGQAQLARAAITGEPAGHHPAAMTKAVTAPQPDDGGYALLKPLAFAAADAASALAADDLAGYQQQLPGLRAALQSYLKGYAHAPNGPLGKFAGTLRDPADLRAARRDFEPFTTVLADEARALHLTHREGLHVFECPMTPVLGTGRWLSRTTALRNPFFGSAMLECGAAVN